MSCQPFLEKYKRLLDICPHPSVSMLTHALYKKETYYSQVSPGQGKLRECCIVIYSLHMFDFFPTTSKMFKGQFTSTVSHLAKSTLDIDK